MVPCHSCHIYRIWTIRSKKVWGILKSHQLGVAMQVTKEGSLHREDRFSVCNCDKCSHYCIVKLYCKSYWVYTVKDFIGYLFSLYYCCFTCLRLAKPKMQLKSKYPNDINTEWAIPEKFYFTPKNSISLILPPSPSVCVFL